MWSVSSREICLIIPGLWQLMPAVFPPAVCLKPLQNAVNVCERVRLKVTEFPVKRLGEVR